jgi:hypothetical protein
MRTRSSLERLAAVAPEEPSIDSGEEEQILRQILASDRRAPRRRRPIAVVLVAAVAVGAAVAAYAIHGHAASPSATSHRPPPLSGARIEAAGYHFRTPAGFTSSDASCQGAAPAPSGTPETPANAMRSAASADGGCIEILYLIAGDPMAPTPSMTGQPVDVGSYQGYYDPQGDAGATLYVELPHGNARPVFLVLYAQGLTEDQLIAVAESGLPGSP